MVGVIILFSKIENARYIKSILVRNGIEVTAVHTCAGQALASVEDFAEGLIICGDRVKDMQFHELTEYLPDGFEMIVIGSGRQWEDTVSSERISRMIMPVKVHELLEMVSGVIDRLEESKRRRRTRGRVRSLQQRQRIREAEEILMKRYDFTENEAYKYLQKNSMDSGVNLTEMAEMILSMYQRER